MLFWSFGVSEKNGGGELSIILINNNHTINSTKNNIKRTKD